MTIDTKDMLNSILSSISRIDYVRPDDIPNIDLYMDQVTTFMEKELASSKRHEDKEECYTFFEDICTINELLSLSQRFEVAKMLREHKTYLEIARLFYREINHDRV